MDLFYVLAIVYLAAVAGEYITGFMSQLSMSIFRAAIGLESSNRTLCARSKNVGFVL